MEQTSSRRRLSTVAAVLAALLVASVLQGGVAEAAAPGANGRIAYAKWNDARGVSELFVASATGADPVKIGEGEEPTWSPDGTRIAHVAMNDDIRVVSANGANGVTLGKGYRPSFSPDGRRVVFARMAADYSSSTVYWMPVDRSAPPKSLGRGWDPVWAPRGNVIAYVNDVGIAQLTIDAAGAATARKQLYRIPANTNWGVAMPDYNPDMTRILFAEGGSACTVQVKHTKLDGTDKRTASQGCNGYPGTWSPDGRSVLYALDWATSEPELAGGGVYSARADGTSRRLLAPDGYTPAWQPVPFATAVTTTAAPTSLVFGAATTLKGQLVRSGTSTGVPSRPVVLEVRRIGTTTWSRAASTTTRANGAYSFTHKPSWIAEYRVRHAASNGWPASTGPVRRVNVAPAVTGALSASSITLGKSVTMTGKVSPAHAGQPVRLERLVSGTWKAVTTRNLSSTSTYSFAIKPTARGTFTYRVVRPADPDHTAGRSPQRALKVT